MKKSLSIAVSAAFVAGAATNVFAANELRYGYQVGSADQLQLLAGGHETEEGKCGEGKCGESDKKEGEGKCGEGKCGAA